MTNTNCTHNWLECNCKTETLPLITEKDLQQAREESFQEGVKFAMVMMGEVDLEPMGMTHVCFGCYKTEFLTDAEAEEKGWASDACGECVANGKFMEMTDTAKEDITQSPYMPPSRNFKPKTLAGVRY